MSEDIHQTKRLVRMSRVDRLPADVRQVVYDEGLTIVDAFMAVGVTKAKHMRHLIRTIRQGSVEIGNRTENPMLKA